ncbi:Proteinase inhibitor I25, cystatin, conserved region [Trema orientale]|uniref:Proteinase inhibitor I25, cystatin, conserved region n=1 Tax=Trema orientale TaxID=63057 RepID=A0A2P5EB81_TREOI|nr:Proteinase inhibitor I25, cystatin, conserved region [Trema orientale]
MARSSSIFMNWNSIKKKKKKKSSNDKLPMISSYASSTLHSIRKKEKKNGTASKHRIVPQVSHLYEGFYVGNWVQRDDLVYDLKRVIYLKDTSVGGATIAAAKYALEEHNKNEGTDLKLCKIVRANYQNRDPRSPGWYYYLTLKASDNCFYETKVLYQPVSASWSVKLFRSALHYHNWKAIPECSEILSEKFEEMNLKKERKRKHKKENAMATDSNGKQLRFVTCSCFFDDDDDDDDDDDTSFQIFLKYSDLYKTYEGFYVGEDHNDCEVSMIGGIYPVQLPSHGARVATKFALEQYNKKEASDQCFYETIVLRRGVGGSKSRVILFRTARHYHSWRSINGLKIKALGDSKSKGVIFRCSRKAFKGE